MINKLLLVLPLLVYCVVGKAQRTEYKGVFAPTADYIKPEEKPYRQAVCLNGSWQFQPIALPAKFREGIDPTPELPPVQPNGWDKMPIRIPSPWNVNSFADKDGQGGDFRCYPGYPRKWEQIKMGWLRKRFIVPAGFKGQRIQLHFDALAGDAEILVNGKQVGHHFGIFLPFDIDITNAVTPGREAELLIGVRKPSLFDKRSDYGRRTYQAGSFWGQHIAGIWQDVYLVALPPVRITDVYIQPRVDAGELLAEVAITNDGDAEAKLTLNATVVPWKDRTAKKSLAMLPVVVKIPANSTIKTTLLSLVKGQLKYWSPETPNLYNLVITTDAANKTIDRKTTRFGWRQVLLKGDKVLLNGKELVMRGDSWHFLGIPQMSRRYAESWYKAMRDAKLNAVRLHAQPYPSFYLDVADEMGMLVLDETAMWASDGGPKLNDAAYWQDSKQHMAELVLRDRNHPCVFGWSISNEIMPIVRGVMRDPPGMRDTLVKYYSEWANICRQLDPSRQWISADGEDDGAGHLPVYMVHYGGTDAMKRGAASGKPWGVGEAGNAYYGTPEQVAETNGDRAYESFLGRMNGVAASSYQSLMGQKQYHAIYQSVFNMVWYGLRPLPLGKKDTTKPPTPEDGVYFTYYKEGMPGVQPERLGPYCTTLNPGYDPSLPLYQTWPLFNAIRDAAFDTAIAQRWKQATQTNVQAFSPSFEGSQGEAVRRPAILAGPKGELPTALKRTGVLFNDYVNNDQSPALLFIDGAEPPAAENRALIDKTLSAGGTVVIWGPSETQLPALNRLLPATLQITKRTASSLVVVKNNDITKGLTNAGLYLSELRPAEFIMQGLSGPLIEQSNILIKAPETDWLKWNKQPEYAKTGMVIRSELEAKPSGVALIEKKIGAGRLVVTTLPASPRLAKAEKAVRQLLSNLGAPLGPGSDVGKPLRKTGDIVRALYLGSFPVASVQDGLSQNFVEPSSGEAIKKMATIQNKTWQALFAENSQIDFSKLKLSGPGNNAVAYLSFWVSSPRDLSDLLIEPNIPIVDLQVLADDAAQVWLNGQSIINTTNGGNAKAAALKLHQGWNHFLVKVVQGGGGWNFSGRFTCNQPDFLADLESALEKP